MQNIQQNALQSSAKIVQFLEKGFYCKMRVADINYEQGPFIDEQFPHSQDSISLGASIKPHLWIPAEELHHNPSYSSQLKNIEQIRFSKISINYAMMILSWFVPKVFDQIINRQINLNHFYYFDVIYKGVIQQIKIDSYVPVDSLHNQELFAKNYQGSIFPCVYQKMLAKLYGHYSSIPDDYVQLVQSQAIFCRQQISISKIKNHQSLLHLKKTIENKIQDKSIVFFKTRSSIRLSTFGIEQNYWYLITRIIEFSQQKYGIVQFLQMSNSKWIGKYSKLRSNWHLHQQFVQKNNLNLMFEVKQNYMSFQDMKGIARDIIILNNCQNYHKTWIQSVKTSTYSTTSIRNKQQILNYYTFSLKQKNKILLQLGTLQSNCRCSLILIKIEDQQLSYTNKNQRIYKTQGVKQLQSKQNIPKAYQILQMSFKDNKTSNYIQFQCVQGRYIIAVIIQQQKNKGERHVLTLFSSQQKVNIQSLTVQQYRTQSKLNDPFYVDLNYQILNEAFTKFIQKQWQRQKNFEIKEVQQKIIIRQMYQSCGLGFIFVKVSKEAAFHIKVQFNLQKMNQNEVIPISETLSHKQIIRQGQYQLYIFKLYWSKIQKGDPNSNIFYTFKPEEKVIQQQRTMFPPFQSVKITKIYQK